MSNVHSDSRVVSITSRQGLATTLDTMVDQLNRCQKALNEFLEVPNINSNGIQLVLVLSK